MKCILDIIEIVICLVSITACVLLCTIGSSEWLKVVYPLEVIFMYMLFIVIVLKRSVVDSETEWQ